MDILRGKRTKVKHSVVGELIRELIARQTKATSEQVAQFASVAATAPFTNDLLEVDEPLWGSFWHFDVISPGYRVPAVELALLRAIRLDQHWPEGTGLDQFLVDLRHAILQPDTGVWALLVAGEPCVMFASTKKRPLAVVAWYCATTGQLHAGYQTAIRNLHLINVAAQREPSFLQQHGAITESDSDWLVQVIEQKQSVDIQTQSLAARLDVEILRFRASEMPL